MKFPPQITIPSAVLASFAFCACQQQNTHNAESSPPAKTSPDRIEPPQPHEQRSVSLPPWEQWITNRSPGFTIQQNPTNLNRGKISLGHLECNLGETPPLYRYQIKTKKNPVLIGTDDTRHRFHRSISVVKQSSRTLDVQHCVSVSYPRSATPDGFVFRTDEDPISTIGVIIPDVHPPSEASPTSDEWVIDVRLKTLQLDNLSPQIKNLKPLVLDDRFIVCMHQTTLTQAVRVLWLKINEEGDFEIQ